MQTPRYEQPGQKQAVGPQEIGALALELASQAEALDDTTPALYIDGRILSGTTIEDVDELRSVFDKLQANEIDAWRYGNRVNNILGNFVLEATGLVKREEQLTRPSPGIQMIKELAPEDHFATMEPDYTELRLRLRLLRHTYGDDSQAIMNALLETGYQMELASHLDKLATPERQATIQVLFDSGEGEYIAKNLDKLEPAEQRTVVEKLLEEDYHQEVAENLEKLKPVHRLEIAEKIIEDCGGDSVAYHLDVFSQKDQGKLITALFEIGDSDQVAFNIKKISTVHHQRIAYRLIDEGPYPLLTQLLPDLHLTNPTRTALNLAKIGYPENIPVIFKHHKNVDKGAVIKVLVDLGEFNFLVHNRKILELRDTTLLKLMTKAEAYDTIAHNLSHFGKCKDSIGVQIIQMGYQRHAAKNIGVFRDKRAIAEALIENNTGGEVLRNFAKFEIPETEEFVMRCIKAGGLIEFLENIEMFKKVDKSKVADYLLANERLWTLATEYTNKLGAALKIPSDLIFQAFKNNLIALDDLIKLQNNIVYASSHAQWKSIIEATGNLLTPALMIELEELQAGNLEQTKTLQAFGVTKSGQEGMRQFLDIIRSIKSRLLNPDKEIIGLAIDSDEIQRLMEQCYRADDGTYRHHDFATALQQAYEDFDNYLPREGFRDSQVYKIHSTNAKHNARKQKFNEDVVLRYQRIKSQLETAVSHIESMAKGESPYGETFAKLTNYIQTKAGQLATRHAEISQNDQQSKSLAGLEAQADKLQAALANGVDSLEHLENNFLRLAKDNKLTDDIMALLLARLMRFDLSLPPAERKKHYSQFKDKIANLAVTPTSKSLTDMIGLVEKLQTAGKQNFQNNKVHEGFGKLTSVDSLSIALSKLNKHRNIGLVFQPSRGLLLEVSGQLADACWEDNYPRIADQFPNITSITIRRDPGGKNDRLVGSFILIETKDDDTNEPVLIIRGLNPIENFINSVDVEDFFDAVIDYTQKTAKQLGAKLGIAIADSSSNFGTNRPAIHGYMAKMKKELTQIPVPESETTFNGYNIEDGVYHIPR
jgi:hypothetical protein